MSVAAEIIPDPMSIAVCDVCNKYEDDEISVFFCQDCQKYKCQFDWGIPPLSDEICNACELTGGNSSGT